MRYASADMCGPQTTTEGLAGLAWPSLPVTEQSKPSTARHCSKWTPRCGTSMVFTLENSTIEHGLGSAVANVGNFQSGTPRNCTTLRGLEKNSEHDFPPHGITYLVEAAQVSGPHMQIRLDQELPQNGLQ